MKSFEECGLAANFLNYIGRKAMESSVKTSQMHQICLSYHQNGHTTILSLLKCIQTAFYSVQFDHFRITSYPNMHVFEVWEEAREHGTLRVNSTQRYLSWKLSGQ